MNRSQTQEQLRLSDNTQQPVPQWYKWGPYVAERSWGTVREDYSHNGDAWAYFPFEKAHQKTYRWGEDGIAGWCDRYQVLVFSPVFWNGKDPILKERLFGLTPLQGNHGEDVKEAYYYLDGTPTHSYMKYLYKYPQAEFPYNQLKERNANRSLAEPEYELRDTNIFADNRYFDVVIEYAKASPEDLCIRIEAFNRGDQSVPLHILPHLWFRNKWAWGDTRLPEPNITNHSNAQKEPCLLADDTNLISPPNLYFDYHLGKRYLYGSEGGKALFTNNEDPSIYGQDLSPGHRYFKDAFHRAIIQGEKTVNLAEEGTKACLHYFFEEIPANGSAVVYLRLSDCPLTHPLDQVESIIAKRKEEADEFYRTICPLKATADEQQVQRQALAGMLWTKQIYLYDVHQWLKGDNAVLPPPTSRYSLRNVHWKHLNSMRILSMPDKWEFPWFASWDLAYHCLSIGLVDIEFAKEQLWLLLFDQFQHPNGAIPAYEWEFSDLNPPVQAWAAYQLFQMQKEQTGIEDYNFLKKCFLKLIMNFTFWVNKVDSSGSNVFEGGFLGLDNITLVDRSKGSIGGATLKQSDGTGWMAMFCLNLMRISLELAKKDHSYEAMATKFFQHFAYIAAAMGNMGKKKYNMWSQEEGFFYDILVFPDGSFTRFHVRSLVGLIPLYAVEIISEEELAQFPSFKSDLLWFLKNRPLMTKECILSFVNNDRKGYLLTLVNKENLKRVLHYVWDPQEFRSSYGLRSLSQYHEEHPFFYNDIKVGYEPGDALNFVKGGNSNWRGPIWFPTTYLLIQALKKYSAVFEELEIENHEEKAARLGDIALSFANRLISIFTKDAAGKRPFQGPGSSLAHDPYFKDLVQFHEYFHAETGQGLGASHQTGWTGLVANLIDEFRR